MGNEGEGQAHRTLNRIVEERVEEVETSKRVWSGRLRKGKLQPFQAQAHGLWIRPQDAPILGSND